MNRLEFLEFGKYNFNHVDKQTAYFKFGNDKLCAMNSFYGLSLVLNPGPNHERISSQILDKEEISYIFSFFERE